MVYIALDELKEILPDIFNAWMDGDDESWEWIFQEIEQKCHVGKKKKDKKQKKLDELTRKVDEVIPKIMGDFDARINAQTKRIDELSNKISHLSVNHTAMVSRVDRVERDIKATKSMAQTAKQRTDVNYTQISECCKEKSDADVVQEVYNRMSGRGATFEELDAFSKVMQKYDALNKKEIPVIKKMCDTCKYYCDGDPDHRPLPRFNMPPCNSCNGNDKWEAKDNE